MGPRDPLSIGDCVPLLAICWTIFPHWGDHFVKRINLKNRLMIDKVVANLCSLHGQ